MRMSRSPLLLAALSAACVALFSPGGSRAAVPSPGRCLSGPHLPARLWVVPRIREVIVSEPEPPRGHRLSIEVSGEANVAGWDDIHLVPVYYPAAGIGWP